MHKLYRTYFMLLFTIIMIYRIDHYLIKLDTSMIITLWYKAKLRKRNSRNCLYHRYNDDNRLNNVLVYVI